MIYNVRLNKNGIVCIVLQRKSISTEVSDVAWRQLIIFNLSLIENSTYANIPIRMLSEQETKHNFGFLVSDNFSRRRNHIRFI